MNKFAALGLASTLLVGCVTQPKLPSVEAGSNQWSMQGRLSLKQASSATRGQFTWHQYGEQFELKIFGPFGGDQLAISGGPSGALLLYPDGQEQVLGIDQPISVQGVALDLPMRALSFWLRGELAPGDAADVTKGPQGEIIGFTQQNWRVAFDSYEIHGLRKHPTLIEATQSGLKIKVKVFSFAEGAVTVDSP